jgi:hypothetical protein
MKTYLQQLANLKTWITPLSGYVSGSCITFVTAQNDLLHQAMFWLMSCIFAGFMIPLFQVPGRDTTGRMVNQYGTTSLIVLWFFLCMLTNIQPGTIISGCLVMAICYYFVFEKSHHINTFHLLWRVIDTISGVRIFKKNRYNFLLFLSVAIVNLFLAFQRDFQLFNFVIFLLCTTILVAMILRFIQGKV